MDVFVKDYRDLNILRNIKGIKLNLGSGYEPEEGFINVDILKSDKVDVIASLENLPFKDESIDLIYTRHTLEHVINFKSSMEEIYRILNKGGLLYIVVPYGFSFSAIYPDHKRFFNIYSFDIFDPNKSRTFDISQEVRFRIIAKKYRFSKMSNPIKKAIMTLIIYFANNHKEIFENNFFAKLFSPYEIEFILQKV